MGKHLTMLNITFHTLILIIYCYTLKKQKGLTMRKSASNGTVSAVTMFEGRLVFVTDNPSKAVST